MDNIRKKYQILILIIVLVMGIIIGVIYLYSMKSVEDIYEQYAEESIIDVKKSFIKDNVNNIISNIEQKKEKKTKYYKQLTDNSSEILDEYYQHSQNIFLDLCIEYFKFKDNKDIFSVLILDKVSNTIIYDRDYSNSNKEASYTERISLMKHNLSSYFQNSYGQYDVFWGVSKDYIDDIIKKQIHDEIHNSKFSNDAYIWINEVVNYEGGDNYAIRRVHPNLTDTENELLSTNTKDIKGNHPYLTELNGVKKNGEIFFNYYFQKKNSNIISEKLTYAKLYKEYDWIIAMGVYMDDIESYVEKTTTESKQIITRMVTHIALWIIWIIILIIFFLTLLEKWYYKNYNMTLNKEIYIDPLTKAYNRRAAVSHISSAFKNFKKTGLSPAIIMIDVDDFKKINDTYGHDAGDFVLINIAEILNKHIRSTDILCRWGGEEFLLICDRLKADDVFSFANKLLDSISQFEYESNDNKYKVTISMGVSYFDDFDNDFNSAIKRADVALYNAKNQGKNRVCM
ncbi:diguanylate cyclase [Gottschalkia acidurici 9a]|uniref:Diguanylate cyclase n=1 Tax=Gottschalkia acidurici (strain ATCC 7906 / DSM 604 / BCRC 14475 / CIP 104303 / KCTC 5404 / NCIMB 10678 / 9a) TaxID=1128398 RepID=K0AXV9_GOTA9|nr:sensor domain-containing diguanylate cyclase [Gottschalkia acidurici]AFS77617.1 diguanylate cyclase [Gottschalkia acidurici 9a]